MVNRLATIGIFPHESEIQLHYDGIILADDGKVKLSLFIYGGEGISSRLTFFVNHQPVQFNEGTDFIEIQMEYG